MGPRSLEPIRRGRSDRNPTESYMVAKNGGSEWDRHFREILQDPERVHAQQRAAVDEHAAESTVKGWHIVALERHYVECMEVLEKNQIAPCRARKEYNKELEKGASAISQFSRRHNGQDLGRLIDINAGICISLQARIRLQASNDWLAKREKDSRTSEGIAI